MLKIRLTRMGRRHLPAFRIVVMDSRKKRDGAFIEKLGFYQPQADPPKLVVDEERSLHWLSVGAQPTLIVKNLFRQVGVNEKFHQLKYGKGGADTKAAGTSQAVSDDAVETAQEESKEATVPEKEIKQEEEVKEEAPQEEKKKAPRKKKVAEEEPVVTESAKESDEGTPPEGNSEPEPSPDEDEEKKDQEKAEVISPEEEIVQDSAGEETEKSGIPAENEEKPEA